MTSVRVAVRIKPIIPASTASSAALSSIRSLSAYAQHVFGPDVQQHQVYDTIFSSVFPSFLRGEDCCVLAYGQTGSGKTHTILGPPASLTEATLAASGPGVAPDTWGVLPRALLQLLAHSSTVASSQILISAVEIYLDRVFDLLNDRNVVVLASTTGKHGSRRIAYNTATYGADGKWVNPYHTAKETLQASSYHAQGQTEVPIVSSDDVARVVRQVDITRMSRGHALNDRSSRSHCVVTVTYARRVDQRLVRSQLLFVDLAGSERVKKSGVIADGHVGPRSFSSGGAFLTLPGTRMDEARNVNTSLAALGRVISALASRSRYVPYRDSTLTMILKKSLGGASRTIVVLTVCEDDAQRAETESTLRFGECLAVVRTRSQAPRRAPAGSADPSLLVSQLQSQHTRIKNELARLEAAGHAGGIDHRFPKPTIRAFEENRRKLARVRVEMQDAKKELTELRSRGSDTSAVAAKIESLRNQDDVLNGIVLRQMSTGIWKRPTPQVVAKRAELDEIASELKQLQLV